MLVYLNYNIGITKQSNNWKHGQFDINTYNWLKYRIKYWEIFTFIND
jgi:hypothetical protein